VGITRVFFLKVPNKNKAIIVSKIISGKKRLIIQPFVTNL